jgi:hypothetical protein
VLRAKGFSATGQDQDDVVVMPYTLAQKRITGTFWLDDIFCSTVSRDTMTEATNQITGLLRERHHLTSAEDDDFNVRRPEDLIQAQLAAAWLCRCDDPSPLIGRCIPTSRPPHRALPEL